MYSLATYKARIKNGFFPVRGHGAARLSVARKAIAEYRKQSPLPDDLADLMLFYVEMGVQYTNICGDIDAAFYRGMESRRLSSLGSSFLPYVPCLQAGTLAVSPPANTPLYDQ